jgi:hypothetical protein
MAYTNNASPFFVACMNAFAPITKILNVWILGYPEYLLHV